MTSSKKLLLQSVHFLILGLLSGFAFFLGKFEQNTTDNAFKIFFAVFAILGTILGLLGFYNFLTKRKII